MVKHSSRIQLSQSALKNNYNFIRKNLKDGQIISSVVKANAYGHGIHEFVKMAEKCGINHFSTASAFEAEEVLEVAHEDTQIMIMGILYDSDIKWAIEHEIEFFVFEYDRLKLVKEIAKEINKKAKVHIEVETGTNRTGMREPDFKRSLTFLKKNSDYITFQGLCTHLAGAESAANDFRIQRQIKKYKHYLKLCKDRKFMPKIRHVACSAAIFTYPETHYDMVRVGISQYGFWPSDEIYHKYLAIENKKKAAPLKRILTWKTDVMNVKEVKKDEFIGYGTTFQANNDMTIAVMPLGYSNGYSRNLSNRGYVLIKGKKAPIVGLINMNLFMCDISHIKDVQPGDEVILIGRQKNLKITVHSFSNTSNLLNNEMLSRIPAAIPRKIVK